MPRGRTLFDGSREKTRPCQPSPNGSTPPKVSIIIANYDRAQALEETLGSIVGQTYPNIELIIIDNASTDRSIEVIKKHESHINRWVSESDRGIYDAFNKGIRMSSGEWVYFIGSGDRLIGDNALARALSASKHVDLIYANVYYHSFGSVYAGKFSKRRLVDQNICQQAIFYHRRLFEMLGMFETSYPLLADWVFNMRCFGDDRVRTRFVDEVIAFWEGGGASTTGKDPYFWHQRGSLIKDNLGISSWVYFIIKYRLGLGTLLIMVCKPYKYLRQAYESRDKNRRPNML